MSATFGGPIVRDRAHFFGNYEIEREPRTVTFSSAFPSFNIDQAALNRQRKAVVRLDLQLSPQVHWYARDRTATSTSRSAAPAARPIIRPPRDASAASNQVFSRSRRCWATAP